MNAPPLFSPVFSLRNAGSYFATTLIYLIALFSGFTNTALGNESPELDRLLDMMEKKVAETRTVQANFTQQRFLKIFTKPVTFHGKLSLQRPGNLRWENTAPIASVMIFSGERGIRCNADAQPVHFDLQSDPVMKMVSQQIWAWADSSYRTLKDQYTIVLKEPTLLELTPRDTNTAAAIQSILVRFHETTLQPEEITILEPPDDKTVIRFSDYLLNQTIPDQLFTACFPN